MRYTGIQPQYFPRLHYFARVLNTDFFVIRDEVQFVAKHKYPNGEIGPSYQVHSPIKTSQGMYMTQLPVKHNGLQPIHSTSVLYDKKWITQLLKTIYQSYNKAPFSKLIFPQIEDLFKDAYSSVAELNTKTILWSLSHLMGVKNTNPKQLELDLVNNLLSKQQKYRLKKVYVASKMKASTENEHTDPNQKILAIIKEVGANEDYCGGTAINSYMDTNLFGENNVKVSIQDWTCPEYQQLHPKQGFISNLSIIDLLMNVSPDQYNTIFYEDKK